MKEKDLFKLPNNIKGIVITTMDSFVTGNYAYAKRLCYTQDNKLFTLVEENITYPEDEEYQEYTVTTYHIGDTLVNYTIIPEFDSILNDESNKYYRVNFN